MRQVLRDNNYYLGMMVVFLLIGGWILTVFSKGDVVLYFDRIHSPALDTFFKYATKFGEGIVIVGTLLFLGAYRLFHMVYGAITMAVSSLLVQGLKRGVFPEYDRPRLFFEQMDIHFVEGVHVNSHYSFPSGHSAAAFCLLTIVAISTRSRMIGLLWFAIALAVGISRVYLKQHFFMDIYTGALVGTTIAIVVYQLVKGWKDQPWASRSILGRK